MKEVGLSRRSAIKSGMAGLVAVSASVAGAQRQVDRPNVLWIVSEDNNPFIGAYGDPIARTPNLDALAAKGVLFRHAYSNAPVCAPSRFSILTGVHSQAVGPAHHMRAIAKLAPELRTYPEYLRSVGYFCANNDKTDYNCDVEAARIWNEQGSKAHWRNRPAGSPFMAVFNLMTTHEMMLFSRTEGAVRPEDVRVPAYLPDTPAVRGDIASYYNLMSRMDAHVGERLAELAADGLADDTIVFYYSDNGGVLPRSKRYCYDEGLRCGLIVHVPPKWRHLLPVEPGSTLQAPVSSVDFAPTLLAIAGIAVPPTMHGKPFMGGDAPPRQRFAFGMRNRMDERYDFVRTATDGRYRYIRNYMPHRPWGMHGGFEWQAKGYQEWERELLAGRLDPVQARFFGPKPYEEFYDLQADRDQVDNRIDDPGLAKLVGTFRRALDRHMLEIVDNGFIPEGSSPEGYRESRMPGAFPLRRIMMLAQAAARGDRRKTALLHKGLADTNAVVRYWAATGFLIRASEFTAAPAVLRDVAKGDASLPVRIVAAEALVRTGSVADGIRILASLAAPSRPWQVRLQALNALTELGEASHMAIEEIRLAARDRQEYVRRAGAYLEARLDGTYDPAQSSVGPGRV